MNTPAVQVSGVAQRYGSRTALRDVSFEAGRGELFGVIGQNGSGKSTLFNILSTFSRPSEGMVRVMGMDIVHRPEMVRTKIGVVFQHPCLDHFLSVDENLSVHGRLYGLSGAGLRARVEEETARAGLGSRTAERAGTLSGGLRRRLELAKALIHQPEVLFMDEPTAALDPVARADFWQHLDKLRQDRGLTVLLTTHHMDEAARCDRLIILHDGAVLACGTPESLKGGVGSAVLIIETGQPESVIKIVESRFGVKAQLVDRQVRFEAPRAAALVAELAEALGEDARSITFSRPSLEDVFIKLTGRNFRKVEP